jgi:hypothetical protein
MLFTLSLAHRILRPRVSFFFLNMLHPWPTHTVMQQERKRFQPRQCTDYSNLAAVLKAWSVRTWTSSYGNASHWLGSLDLRALKTSPHVSFRFLQDTIPLKPWTRAWYAALLGALIGLILNNRHAKLAWKAPHKPNTDAFGSTRNTAQRQHRGISQGK